MKTMVCRFLVLLGLVSMASQAQVPTLIHEIAPGEAGAQVRGMARFDRDRWLFTADDGVHGRELWMTDGTSGGTAMVRDIASGPEDGLRFFSVPVVLAGRAYFEGYDSVHGFELWASDGTTAGTHRVTEIRPGSDGTGISFLRSAGDSLYFMANDGVNGLQLWSSRGTADSTMVVTPLDSNASGLCAATAWRGRFYGLLKGDDAAGLVRSEGTVGTTEVLSSLEPFCTYNRPGDWIHAGGENIWFSAEGQLWRSDGTVGGTGMIRELGDGFHSSRAVSFGNRVFFGTTTATAGFEPWISDGTVAGTYQLVDLVPGDVGSSPVALAGTDDRLFFAAEAIQGRELWVTDGTETGTRQVVDLWSGSAGSSPALVAGEGQRLLFHAADGTPGRGLFVSDGRAAGTRKVAAITPTTRGVISAEYGGRAGRLMVFAADDGQRGDELWLLDTLCYFGGTPLWLHEGRFRVDACWRRFDDTVGVGQPSPLTEETGGFSFFNPANLDLSVKIIDGRASNGQWWFFFGSLTNVAGKVRVTDTASGAYREFELAPGLAESFAAIDGFPNDPPVSAPLLPATPQPVPPLPVGGGCDSNSMDLCVQDGRFRVAVRWSTGNGEGEGVGVRTAGNSGHFWFFRPENLELLVKIHDGRPANGHFWVFLGALSNLAYTVTVTDTTTGSEKEYVNARGDYQSILDTLAFAD